MNMREQFVNTTLELFNKDEKTAILLGGISVASFNEAITKAPNRAFNAGICEQAIISMAAGMAMTGMIPIVHTIAPFLVERAYEQLKLDFGYQKQRGNFVTTGASLDYSSFGATHQCPADINVLKQIPDMQIIIPGTAEEFRELFLETYNNDFATYIRTSRDENKTTNKVKFGQAEVIKHGNKATVIAIGPTLDMVMEASQNLDVSVLYYTTITPFDYNCLYQNCFSGKLLICMPFYTGGLLEDINISLRNKPHQIFEIGIPHKFAEHYGYTKNHYEDFGITIENISNSIRTLIG